MLYGLVGQSVGRLVYRRDEGGGEMNSVGRKFGGGGGGGGGGSGVGSSNSVGRPFG